jgi:hypothetical protein
MRPSTAILSGTGVRLSDLRFPAQRVHIGRTRLAYIHLDNLLNFAKIDRDGRIDGYLAAYLPNELALIFFRRGEAVTAVAFTDRDRTVVPIGNALKAMKDEIERGELTFCEASFEQLVWMYHAGAALPQAVPVDPRQPTGVFEALLRERYSGLVEFIADGRVSYLRLADGRFQSGVFAEKPDDVAVPAWIERLVAPHADGAAPTISAGRFATGPDLPEQASPALLEAAREVYWRLVEHVEREAPNDGMRRALRLRDGIALSHPAFAAVSTPRGQTLAAGAVSPQDVMKGLAEWARRLLEQMEVVAPGIAPAVLKSATKDYRFVLQRAGFYGLLPWSVTW